MVMAIEIRACVSEKEFEQAIAPLGHYFGRPAARESGLIGLLPVERTYAAWEDDRVIGGLGSFPFQLTVPGGTLFAAGVTVAGVLPTHRRRGVLRAMMRALLDECYQRSEHVAYLWATEDTIYGRFGFGLASFSAAIDLPRERGAFCAPFEAIGRVRLVPLAAAEEFVAPVYARIAAATPGMFARSPAWWQGRVLADPDRPRGRGGNLQCAVLEDKGRPAAYALYQMNWAPEQDRWTGTVAVTEALAESPAAMAAIWRYLLDMDLMARIRASLLPVDHPLLLLLAEPRRLDFTLRAGIWTRLIDVERALSARSYQPYGSVVIEVADEFCPWNAGCWRVGFDGVGRTSDAPHLRCDVTALGSVYLGGFTWSQLARSLRVQQTAAKAAAAADAIFQTTNAPWCPEVF
jgi:predicted acetyltransferase